MFTRSEWQATKKKLGDALQAPAKKENIGPNLDKFHKSDDYDEKLKLIEQIRLGVIAYQKANQGNAPVLKALAVRYKEVLEAPGELSTAWTKEVDKYVNALTIEDVWDVPTLKQAFLAFLKKEHSTENAEFISAVDRRTNNQAIYETFIADGKRKHDGKLEKQAPSFINISSGARKELMDLAENGDYQSMKWDTAYKEIWALIKKDSLGRFKEELKEKYYKDPTAKLS